MTTPDPPDRGGTNPMGDATRSSAEITGSTWQQNTQAQPFLPPPIPPQPELIMTQVIAPQSVAASSRSAWSPDGGEAQQEPNSFQGNYDSPNQDLVQGIQEFTIRFSSGLGPSDESSNSDSVNPNLTNRNLSPEERHFLATKRLAEKEMDKRHRLWHEGRYVQHPHARTEAEIMEAIDEETDFIITTMVGTASRCYSAPGSRATQAPSTSLAAKVLRDDEAIMNEVLNYIQVYKAFWRGLPQHVYTTCAQHLGSFECCWLKYFRELATMPPEEDNIRELEMLRKLRNEITNACARYCARSQRRIICLPNHCREILWRWKVERARVGRGEEIPQGDELVRLSQATGLPTNNISSYLQSTNRKDLEPDPYRPGYQFGMEDRNRQLLRNYALANLEAAGTIGAQAMRELVAATQNTMNAHEIETYTESCRLRTRNNQALIDFYNFTPLDPRTQIPTRPSRKRRGPRYELAQALKKVRQDFPALDAQFQVNVNAAGWVGASVQQDNANAQPNETQTRMEIDWPHLVAELAGDDDASAGAQNNDGTGIANMSIDDNDNDRRQAEFDYFVQMLPQNMTHEEGHVLPFSGNVSQGQTANSAEILSESIRAGNAAAPPLALLVVEPSRSAEELGNFVRAAEELMRERQNQQHVIPTALVAPVLSNSSVEQLGSFIGAAEEVLRMREERNQQTMSSNTRREVELSGFVVDQLVRRSPEVAQYVNSIREEEILNLELDAPPPRGNWWDAPELDYLDPDNLWGFRQLSQQFHLDLETQLAERQTEFNSKAGSEASVKDINREPLPRKWLYSQELLDRIVTDIDTIDVLLAEVVVDTYFGQQLLTVIGPDNPNFDKNDPLASLAYVSYLRANRYPHREVIPGNSAFMDTATSARQLSPPQSPDSGARPRGLDPRGVLRGDQGDAGRVARGGLGASAGHGISICDSNLTTTSSGSQMHDGGGGGDGGVEAQGGNGGSGRGAGAGAGGDGGFGGSGRGSGGADGRSGAGRSGRRVGAGGGGGGGSGGSGRGSGSGTDGSAGNGRNGDDRGRGGNGGTGRRDISIGSNLTPLNNRSPSRQSEPSHFAVQLLEAVYDEVAARVNFLGRMEESLERVWGMILPEDGPSSVRMPILSNSHNADRRPGSESSVWNSAGTQSSGSSRNTSSSLRSVCNIQHVTSSSHTHTSIRNRLPGSSESSVWNSCNWRSTPSGSTRTSPSRNRRSRSRSVTRTWQLQGGPPLPPRVNFPPVDETTHLGRSPPRHGHRGSPFRPAGSPYPGRVPRSPSTGRDPSGSYRTGRDPSTSASTGRDSTGSHPSSPGFSSSKRTSQGSRISHTSSSNPRPPPPYRTISTEYSRNTSLSFPIGPRGRSLSSHVSRHDPEGTARYLAARVQNNPGQAFLALNQAVAGISREIERSLRLPDLNLSLSQERSQSPQPNRARLQLPDLNRNFSQERSQSPQPNRPGPQLPDLNLNFSQERSRSPQPDRPRPQLPDLNRNFSQERSQSPQPSWPRPQLPDLNRNISQERSQSSQPNRPRPQMNLNLSPQPNIPAPELPDSNQNLQSSQGRNQSSNYSSFQEFSRNGNQNPQARMPEWNLKFSQERSESPQANRPEQSLQPSQEGGPSSPNRNSSISVEFPHNRNQNPQGILPQWNLQFSPARDSSSYHSNSRGFNRNRDQNPQARMPQWTLKFSQERSDSPQANRPEQNLQSFQERGPSSVNNNNSNSIEFPVNRNRNPQAILPQWNLLFSQERDSSSNHSNPIGFSGNRDQNPQARIPEWNLKFSQERSDSPQAKRLDSDPSSGHNNPGQFPQGREPRVQIRMPEWNLQFSQERDQSSSNSNPP